MVPEGYEAVAETWKAFATHAESCSYRCKVAMQAVVNRPENGHFNKSEALRVVCPEGGPAFESWLDAVEGAMDAYRQPRRRQSA